MNFPENLFATGGALGSWLGGYSFDVTGSYTLAFTIAILCLAVATSLLWAAAPRKVRVVGGKVRRQQYSP